MKKYSLSPIIIDLLKEYAYYKEDKGVLPLSSSHVREFKIGKKFAYSTSSAINSVHSQVSKLIFNQYISKIPVNQSATAYLSGKSYYDFIEPHRNNYFFLRLDLKNFFHSISKDIIERNFLEYFSNDPISDKCEQTHAQAIYNLIMYKLDSKSDNSTFKGCEILPMGFPLSPSISNLVFRKIDLLIEKFCDEKGIVYTRYADDMLFSSRGKIVPPPIFAFFGKDTKKRKSYDPPFLHSKAFYEEISYLLQLDGYKINKNKVKKSVHTISINGYTITGSNYSDIKGDIRISNVKTKTITKLIHELKVNKDDILVFKKCFKKEFPTPKYKKGANDFISDFCTNQINNKLVGYKSYIISIVKFDGDKDCLSTASRSKYTKLLEQLDNSITKRLK
ncbi:reverse transcriptase family protein [Vibrio sp. Isolate22]|uniref:reverse transcriptase family protein n=1 Tax=Vibrio TaxID=662 RepID=UPI001BD2CCD0|nr:MULTISPECIES: reverse transcriptase family protein [Vibrio]MBT0074285.1 RNA-directed DNA polymerase [Vibrio alginolyticus]MCG9693585.1 reverse transcriptase family protein [Vibrio sp. Isolate22]